MGFKVGDRVTWSRFPEYGVGTVVDLNESENPRVRFEEYGTYKGEGDYHTPHPYDLLLVGRTPDATKPNYYEFPGGIQPLDLSQHLTHAGGSALDYIARSCRADGVFKSDRIEDLEKAKVWIDVEIARLRDAVERD